MANEYLAIALVLWLSAPSVAIYVALRTNRRLHEHLQAEQNAYHQLLQLTEAKPPPAAGRTFVLTDREVATREQRLAADSRARALALDADAHQQLTRTFRRGSRSSRASSPGG